MKCILLDAGYAIRLYPLTKAKVIALSWRENDT